MKTRKAFFAVLTLVIFVFLQTPVMNAKDLVTRPFHISGQITFFYDGSIMDQGVATHLGKFDCFGTWSSGTYFAANGDELYWEVEGYMTYTIIFTGGTGKFENATGGYAFELVQIPGPEGGMTFAYKGTGTITY